MSKKELCSRYLFFILGILIMSFGIAFMIRSHLGNSPISSLPYVFSEMFPCTVGMCTFIMNLLLMALQLIIMGKRFPKSYWLQIPVSVIFGAFVDFALLVLSACCGAYFLWRAFSLFGRWLPIIESWCQYTVYCQCRITFR